MADIRPWAQVRQGSQPLGRLSELERVVEDRLLRQARRHRVHVESVEGEPWGMVDHGRVDGKCDREENAPLLERNGHQHHQNRSS